MNISTQAQGPLSQSPLQPHAPSQLSLQSVLESGFAGRVSRGRKVSFLWGTKVVSSQQPSTFLHGKMQQVKDVVTGPTMGTCTSSSSTITWTTCWSQRSMLKLRSTTEYRAGANERAKKMQGISFGIKIPDSRRD